MQKSNVRTIALASVFCAIAEFAAAQSCTANQLFKPQTTLEIQPTAAYVVSTYDPQEPRKAIHYHEVFDTESEGVHKYGRRSITWYNCDANRVEAYLERLVGLSLMMKYHLAFKSGSDYGRDLVSSVMYDVFVKGELCKESPKLLFVGDPQTPQAVRQVYTPEDHLRLFYVEMSPHWKALIEPFQRITERVCGEKRKSFQVELLTQYFDGRRSLYKGTYHIREGGEGVWEDVNSEERFDYIIEDSIYRERIERVRRANEQRNQKMISRIIGFSAGLAQGLTLEFGDEGACGLMAALGTLESGDIIRQRYVNCHNYLNDTLSSLQEESGTFYIVGNLLGMLNSTYANGIEGNDANARSQRAVAACLEGITREYGKLRLNEEPDMQLMTESCAFEAALEAAGDALLPSPRSKQ